MRERECVRACMRVCVPASTTWVPASTTWVPTVGEPIVLCGFKDLDANLNGLQGVITPWKGSGHVSGDLKYHDVDSVHSSAGITCAFAILNP